MFPQHPFSRFEAVAQQLVEGSFRRLFSGRIQLYDIAILLARALEDNQRDKVSANQYQVQLNLTDQAVLLQETPDIVPQLTDYLSQLAQQTGAVLAGPPEVLLVGDVALRPQQVRIAAAFLQPVQDETTQVRRQAFVQETLAAIQQLDAFLILDGKRHIRLEQAVMTIGRRTDNDIVLSLPDVSRQHAQIRWRFNRFVIYDLGSRAGTRLNGQRIQESILQPGDVLQLSTATLIYGEGGDGQVRRVATPRPHNEATLVRPAMPRRPKKDGE